MRGIVHNDDGEPVARVVFTGGLTEPPETLDIVRVIGNAEVGPGKWVGLVYDHLRCELTGVTDDGDGDYRLVGH